MRLSNDIWDWLSFCRGSNSEKKWDYCKMIFIIGWGFAERQILKKWKWPYLLNWVEYFDRLQRKYWYWQDLAQAIAKCHFSSVEVLPSFKFWKSENGAISWTEWNIVTKICIHTGYWQDVAIELSNDIWDWSRFYRGSNSEKKWNLTLKPFGIFW